MSGGPPARVWVLGFDRRLVPHAPFDAQRLDDGLRVVICHAQASASPQVLFRPDLDAPDGPGMMVAFAPGTDELGEVIAFDEAAETPGAWWVGTKHFAFPWPQALRLWSTPFTAQWLFELTPAAGHPDAVIHAGPVFAPGDVPELAAWVGPGMKAIGDGELKGTCGTCRWLDLSYAHDGLAWTQRRCLVPIGASGATALLTAQGTTDAAVLLALSAKIACEMVPVDEDFDPIVAPSH